MLARFGVDAMTVVAYAQAVAAFEDIALQPQHRQRLRLHGVQRVADQVDQNLLQTRLIDRKLNVIEDLMQLQRAVLQTSGQQLQRGIHGFVQRSLALVFATSGKGTQAGGDAAHAVDQIVDRAQVGAGGVQRATLDEAHGIAGQRAQCREWLIEFVGDAGGHLPDGREFTGLNQLVLGLTQRLLGLTPLANLPLKAFVAGAQVGGAFGNPTFEFVVGRFQRFAGGQTGGNHLAPLVPGDQQEHCQRTGHGHQHPLIGRFTTQVFKRREQGQVPGRVGQIAGLREVADDGVVVIDAAVGGESQLLDPIGDQLALQRHQLVERPPVILQAAGQALFDLRGQRAHRFQASRRVAGQNDDAVFVADEGFQPRPLPALFQRFEAHLDHGNADDLAFLFQPVGQVITGLAGGAADAVEAARKPANGVLVIGAEGEVFAQVTVGIAPVAGGEHAAGGVEHVDGATAAAAVQAFEVVIDLASQLRRRVIEQLGDIGFELQHAGQVVVLVDFAFDGAGMQFKLPLAVFAEGLDAVLFAVQVGHVAERNHQQDDQRRQKQVAYQAGFHGK